MKFINWFNTFIIKFIRKNVKLVYSLHAADIGTIIMVNFSERLTNILMSLVSICTAIIALNWLAIATVSHHVVIGPAEIASACRTGSVFMMLRDMWSGLWKRPWATGPVTSASASSVTWRIGSSARWETLTVASFVSTFHFCPWPWRFLDFMDRI